MKIMYPERIDSYEISRLYAQICLQKDIRKSEECSDDYKF